MSRNKRLRYLIYMLMVAIVVGFVISLVIGLANGRPNVPWQGGFFGNS